VNSISLDINNELNLSNIEKATIARQVGKVLNEAHEYASSRLDNEADISYDTISNFDQLCQIYQNDKICLFTGAGVSFTESKYYQTPGWWDLLMEVYTRIQSNLVAVEIHSQFKQLRKTYSHPWQMASYLEATAGAEQFTDILRQLFYNRTTKRSLKLRPIGADKDKRLPIDYLNHALTLNAVIAFCSSLRAVRQHPCFVKNEKIHAVLTLNYDCFLEAGATQKFNSGKLKPGFGNEPPEKRTRLPVYHIHGYIPYGGRKPARDLVLTEQSYQKAYHEGGNARTLFNEFLSRFSTLFIGISFNDELLLQHLERLTTRKGAKNHFALLKSGISIELRNRLQAVNVLPIIVEAYEQIPLILKQVYQTNLSPMPSVAIEAKIDGKIRKAGVLQLSREEYWELLFYNKK